MTCLAQHPPTRLSWYRIVFRSEYFDTYIKLNYLRSRWYDPASGRFNTKDSWQGDYNRPLSLNRWMYVEGDPINATDPSGTTPYEPPSLDPCIYSVELLKVKLAVREAICNMISDLEDENLLIDLPDQKHVSEGYRPKEKAHILSTAYHIINDYITIDDLRETPVDLDGNVWYKSEWDYLNCAGIAGKVLLDVLVNQNALSKVPNDAKITRFKIPYNTTYALEGYPTWDPHRLPNTNSPKVSRHTLGEAFDIGLDGRSNPVPWEQFNGKIDGIARRHNLFRAYYNRYIAYADYTAMEWWHFEYIGFER